MSNLRSQIALYTLYALGFIACVVGLVVVGMVLKVEQTIPVFLHASWTPQRSMTVNYQIGAQIHTERFDRFDVGRWELEVDVPPGTELVVVVEQGADATAGGALFCQMWIAGESADKLPVSGTGDCRVEATT